MHMCAHSVTKWCTRDICLLHCEISDMGLLAGLSSHNDDVLWKVLCFLGPLLHSVLKLATVNVWISNYAHRKDWAVITDPCFNFNSNLIKLPLM